MTLGSQRREGKGRKGKECFARGGFLFFIFIFYFKCVEGGGGKGGKGGGEKGIRKCKSILYYKVLKTFDKMYKILTGLVTGVKRR